MKKILLIFTLSVISCSTIDQEKRDEFLNAIQGTWMIDGSGQNYFANTYHELIPIGTKFTVNSKGDFSIRDISFKMLYSDNMPIRDLVHYYTVTYDRKTQYVCVSFESPFPDLDTIAISYPVNSLDEKMGVTWGVAIRNK